MLYLTTLSVATAVVPNQCAEGLSDVGRNFEEKDANEKYDMQTKKLTAINITLLYIKSYF